MQIKICFGIELNASPLSYRSVQDFLDRNPFPVTETTSSSFSSTSSSSSSSNRGNSSSSISSSSSSSSSSSGQTSFESQGSDDSLSIAAGWRGGGDRNPKEVFDVDAVDDVDIKTGRGINSSNATTTTAPTKSLSSSSRAAKPAGRHSEVDLTLSDETDGDSAAKSPEEQSGFSIAKVESHPILTRRNKVSIAAYNNVKRCTYTTTRFNLKKYSYAF